MNCERVATALVCATRSFSTPFIFQWRAINKLMDATSAGVSSLPRGRRRCPGTWSRLIIPTYSKDSASIIALRLCYVGRHVWASRSRSRVRLATPDGPSQHISPGLVPSVLSPSPSPQPLTLLPPRCASPSVPVSPTQSRPSSSQSYALCHYHY